MSTAPATLSPTTSMIRLAKPLSNVRACLGEAHADLEHIVRRSILIKDGAPLYDGAERVVRPRDLRKDPRWSRCRMVYASIELSEPGAAAAPVLADDLCGNGDGGLLGCACTKIKAYRAREPFELYFG